jgi:hypothetical protein
MSVLQVNSKRDTGRKAQLGNIMAAKVSLRPACGPRSLRRAPFD